MPIASMTVTNEQKTRQRVSIIRVRDKSFDSYHGQDFCLIFLNFSIISGKSVWFKQNIFKRKDRRFKKQEIKNDIAGIGL